MHPVRTGTPGIVRWRLTAKTFLAAGGVLLLAPPAYAAIDAESQFVLNTLSLPHLGGAGDVDVRRLHHAGVRLGAHQERLGHLPQEHRAVFGRRADLLPDRLQPDVPPTSAPGSAPVTFLYGPSADELALLSGDATAQAAVVKQNYATMSDWFFQMGLRRHRRLGGVRRPGRAGEAVVLPGLHDHFDGHRLSHHRRLDVGRRPGSTRMGFQDFAGSTIVHSTGGWAAPGRHHGGGAAGGQVPQRRQRQGHAALQRAVRHPGCPHPVVRLARLQRRLPTGAGAAWTTPWR